MPEADPRSSHVNRLANESSPYLRSASHQPVDWYPWGDEAFLTARKENKPILLDIGAVWCHWCHVMDAESYENEATAQIINDNFVAIKVDRDERPDVDSRYQAAVGALAGQGGWPLTAFLTPDGHVFFGGTYFPPEDRYGRVGFPKVLSVLGETFRNEPTKVTANAHQVKQALNNHWHGNTRTSQLSDSMLDEALKEILEQADLRHGGFGTAPKFPHCSTIEFLLSSFERTNDRRMLDAVTATLGNMARGGIYDQLGGGFHRYSTDEQWMVPHFEKMLYDNAPLLLNYVHAFQLTGNELFREIAFDILRYVETVLVDRAKGGFFASQDADVASGDDGSYFTWSLEEVRNILNDNELKIIQMYYGISIKGQMHSDSSRNVLHVAKTIEDIAVLIAEPTDSVRTTIESAKLKMSAVRTDRKTPFVDRSIYASWNGTMISSYLEMFKVFRSQDCLHFALKTLNRILDEHTKNDGTIAHRNVSFGSEAFLEDQVEIANALLQAFEATSDLRYLEKADSLVQSTIELYSDQEHGGFFDVPLRQNAIGLLSVRTKPIQDSPVASANAVAISVLNKLSTLTNRSEYRTLAEQSLLYFSNNARQLGLHASEFNLALSEFLHPPPHVIIVSEMDNVKGIELFEAALETYRAGKTVAHYQPAALDALPSTLKSSVKSFPRPVAYVCSEFSCAPPAYDRNTLISTLRSFGRN